MLPIIKTYCMQISTTNISTQLISLKMMEIVLLRTCDWIESKTCNLRFGKKIYLSIY